MRIEEINASSIRKVDNKELLNLHFRLHQLAGSFKNKKDKREGLTWEDLVNAHLFVVEEMIRRNISHNEHDELDNDTKSLVSQNVLPIIDILKGLEEEVVVIPNFLCLVGSAAKESEFEDIDILVRAEKEKKNYLVKSDNVYLPIRNVFRNLGKSVHIIDNPQGAHGDFIALYDLVLRRKPSFEVEVVKNITPIKVDLGCGENKPEGYIGIDKVQYPGVDIIADLEFGIPLPDNYADEIRAWHFLEHIEDRDFIMSEIWRVLKPGGRLVFEVPSTNSEGAFVPGHKSFWNKTVFLFYASEELSDGRPVFEIEELEEYESNGYKYVRGVLVKPGETIVDLSNSNIKPFDDFAPMKPKMKLLTAQTEAFSIEELEPWLEKRFEKGIAVETKLNGFRCIIHKAGKKVLIYFEDAKEKRSIPEIEEYLKNIDRDFILDCDIGILKNGKRQPRLYLMKLMRNKIEFEKDEIPIVTVFDIIYLDEPLINLPFIERRKILEKFFDEFLKDSKYFDITEQVIVKNKKELSEAWTKLGFVEMSEGVVLKDLEAPYEFGASNALAKIKHVCEIKVIVLGVKKNKNNTFSYKCGILKGDSDFYSEDGKYIALGYTFNSTLEAKEGDIITCTVQEIIVRRDNKGVLHLDWLGAIPIDIDKTRKEPYYAKQVIDIAERANVIQIIEKKKDLEEGETRAERAISFWKNNWYKVYPKSGGGRFIYHIHIRGIPEEDIDLSLEELLKKGYSVHGDLRLETDSGLWGITVFEGSAEDVLNTKHFTRLADLPPNDNLQFTFKLIQPKAWLKVGVKKPYISKPGGVGATSKKYAKFFAIDTGTYSIGVWREHMLELFLDGKIIKGRYLLEYAPIGDSRVWIIDKPKDQEPYASKRKLEDVIKELEAKGQKYLIWCKPGEKPKLYEISQKSDCEYKEYFFEVVKMNEEERFVLAPFAVPYSPDLKNHRIVNIEKLEKALHDFVAFNGSVFMNHIEPLESVRIAEAYILREDSEINGRKFPKGTAFIGFKILDDELWKMIKSGLIRGVSYRAIVRKAGQDN